MCQRDRTYKTAVVSGIPTDFGRFKSLRRIAKNLLDTTKNKYYASALASATNSKPKWKVIRNLGVTAAKIPSPIDYFSPADLNKFYASVCKDSLPCRHSEFENILNSTLCQNQI